MNPVDQKFFVILACTIAFGLLCWVGLYANMGWQ